MLSISASRSPATAFSRRYIASSSKSSKATPFFFPGTKDTAPARKSEPFRMLMLAKPGSGKGTLSSKLTKKYDISFLSSGDILRQHIKDRTDVGCAAEAIVAQGGLLPDDLMIKLLAVNLESLKGTNWILDGFPRTVGQGELLDSYLASAASPLNLIVHLDVPDEVILARISDRWIHPGSGRIYNYSYNRPKIDGIDDITGEALVKRSDDNPEVFARRLEAFYKSTAPLLAYYKSPRGSSASQLVSLAGKTSDEIWPQLDAIIESRFRLKPKASRLTATVPEAVIRQTEREVIRKDSAKRSVPIPASA